MAIAIKVEKSIVGKRWNKTLVKYQQYFRIAQAGDEVCTDGNVLAWCVPATVGDDWVPCLYNATARTIEE